MRYLICFMIIVATSQQAYALTPIPGEDRFKSTLETKNSMGAALGAGFIDEDFFLKLTLRSELNLGKIGVGLQIPLNLRVYDKKPKNDNDYYGLVRREDWDEKSEYLKVIRYVRLGNKRDDFFLRVGELAAQVGHGTIVNRYLNNQNINTLRVGAQFDINTHYAGFETLVGDIGSFGTDTSQSRVVGGRIYVKPLAFVLAEDSLLNRLAIGASFVSDRNAPVTLATTTEPDTGEVFPVTTKEGVFSVEDESPANVYGADIEIQLLHNDLIDLVPYTDFNQIEGAGSGWHVGALATLKMPIGFELSIPVRVEYRRFRSNYTPAYFSTFYELERYTYPLGSDSFATKLQTLRDMTDNDGINGYYADLAFDFAGLVQVGAVYEDYEGANPNMVAFANVPALEIVQFKAYYERINIQGTDDIFKLDDRSMVIAEGRYEMVPFVYLVGRFTRRWLLDGDAAPAKFKPKDDWDVGVEVSFEF